MVPEILFCESNKYDYFVTFVKVVRSTLANENILSISYITSQYSYLKIRDFELKINKLNQVY